MSKQLSTCFDAVLFDLDGTLIDSVADIAASTNYVRGKMGMPHLPVEIIRSYIGDGLYALVGRALGTQELSAIEDALEIWQPHYEIHCLDRTCLYPGITEMLQSIISTGMPLGVVSNKPFTPSKRILDGLGIQKMFSVLVGGDTTSKRKPDPEPLWFAAKQMKISSNRVLVIGDSSNDILGAKNAGYQSCAVLWGIGCEEDIQLARPHYMIKKPEELSNVVSF